MKNVLSTVAIVLLSLTAFARAQVGASEGLIDLNTANEAQLTGLPGITAELAKTITAGQPFASIIDFNKLMLENKLTQEQLAQVYAKAFVHINLNTATREEIILIPGAGRKMAHEFDEYRPWKNWKQFEKEIGKYVGAKETARLAQYCFIPMDINKASADDLKTIPEVDDAAAQKIISARPWTSIDHFKTEFAKTSADKEAARIARFLVVAK